MLHKNCFALCCWEFTAKSQVCDLICECKLLYAALSFLCSTSSVTLMHTCTPACRWECQSALCMNDTTQQGDNMSHAVSGGLALLPPHACTHTHTHTNYGWNVSHWGEREPFCEQKHVCIHNENEKMLMLRSASYWLTHWHVCIKPRLSS